MTVGGISLQAAVCVCILSVSEIDGIKYEHHLQECFKPEGTLTVYSVTCWLIGKLPNVYLSKLSPDYSVVSSLSLVLYSRMLIQIQINHLQLLQVPHDHL